MLLATQQILLGDTDRPELELARHLKSEGIEVSILAPSLVSGSRLVDGIKVYLFEPTPLLRSLSRRVLMGGYTLDMFIKSFTLVKKKKVDLLHAFFSIPPGVALAFCKKPTSRPLVTTVTGAGIGMVKEIRYGFRWKPIPNALINFALKNSDQIIVPSPFFEELTTMAGAERKKITVIPFGVNLENFRIPEKRVRESLRSRFNLVAEDRVVLSLCRHARVKGLNYLLYAMTRVLREHPNVKLVLAGSGKETENLKVIAKNLKIDQNVVFPGFVLGKRKTELLATADIFVQPSLSDAFSLSALEAMASGKPVIMTNRVGLAGFLRNGECGFIVKPSNSDALAEAMLRLLSDDGLRLRLGENARRKAEEFDWNEITKKAAEVYYKALN